MLGLREEVERLAARATRGSTPLGERLPEAPGAAVLGRLRLSSPPKPRLHAKPAVPAPRSQELSHRSTNGTWLAEGRM